MIRHIVLVRYRADVPAEETRAIMAGLGALGGHLDGFLAFEFGPNVSPEGLSKGWDDGFVVTFADRAALDAYLADEEHRRLGARLVAAAEGGLDGILVYDLETS